MANIEFPHEIAACRERGADGIGLYRTEFLYLSSEHLPTEDDHYRAYAEVVQAMASRPVVIRTFDLGADKLIASSLDSELERNPFLGLRGIRLALQHLPLFRPQLRAILRASALGPVRVMFPLVTTLHELRQARVVLAEAMEELDAQRLPFDRRIPVGMMVESPAAATLIDRFVSEVDFVSIGTNDLIQYTLAVDRANPHVADLYQAADPAVLRLIQRTLEATTAADVPACLCGQMSGDVMYTMLLIGLGLRELSVPPSVIPEIKQVCRSVTLAQCRGAAARALTLDSAHEVDAYLREELRKLEPTA
jgi:phosphotransferase system enzyme I (PtsI)